jgi:hypothetical protein
MEMVKKYFSMETDIKVFIQEESLMDLGAMIGLMVVFMKDNLKKDIEMEKGFYIKLMVPPSKVFLLVY